jgi:transcriptional regulator with XRE-family HTH domain
MAKKAVSVKFRNELRAIDRYTPRVTESIGKTIERLREAKGWSRRELHEQSGVSESSIYRIESGAQPPRNTTKAALLSALTRPSESNGGQRERTTSGETIGIEDHLGALIAHVKSLSGEERSKFVRAVVGLLDALEHARPAASSGSAKNNDR